MLVASDKVIGEVEEADTGEDTDGAEDYGGTVGVVEVLDPFGVAGGGGGGGG